jgi:hypothetical protein
MNDSAQAGWEGSGPKVEMNTGYHPAAVLNQPYQEPRILCW